MSLLRDLATIEAAKTANNAETTIVTINKTVLKKNKLARVKKKENITRAEILNKLESEAAFKEDKIKLLKLINNTNITNCYISSNISIIRKRK